MKPTTNRARTRVTRPNSPALNGTLVDLCWGPSRKAILYCDTDELEASD